MNIEHQWLPQISRQSLAYVSSADTEDMARLVQQLSPKALPFTDQKLLALRRSADIILMRDKDVPRGSWSETGQERFKIVAMTCVFPMHLPQGLRLHIENVVVDEAYRGKGVGKHMMKCIEASALMMGGERLQLTSSRPDAQKMYLSLGFTTPKTQLFRKSL
jgi:ribosomal protein S18 acetylase RimI-like enzyme